MTLATMLAPAAEGSDRLTGWDNIWLIVSKPDNIPILIMLVLVGVYTYMALRDARKHDKLIEQGRKKEILKAMQE